MVSPGPDGLIWSEGISVGIDPKYLSAEFFDGGFADWLPALASSELAPGTTGRQVGDVRYCTIDGVPMYAENQTARSESQHSYSYSLSEKPFPMRNYYRTITLRSQGDQTTMEWSSTFDPDPGKEEELIRTIRETY